MLRAWACGVVVADDGFTVEYLGGGSPEEPPATPRSRRGFVVGLVGLLVVAGVAGALLIGRSPSPPDPAANPLPAPGTALRVALDRAGFTGPVGGSLARNAAALKMLRTRVSVLAAANGHALTTPGQVLILWAGDLGPGRYADAVYKQPAGWSRVVLTGDAKTPADQLTEGSWDDDHPDTGQSLTDASATFVSGPGSSGAVFVVAPRARGVEMAATRQFRPGGRVSTTWRPLTKQGGMVWAAPADGNEQYLATYRTTDPDNDRAPALVHPVDEGAAAQAIATGSAAGYESGRGVIVCAADQARRAGASLAEHPVLAVAAGLDPKTVLGAVVLESPDGGWLWGICDSELHPAAEYTGHGVSTDRWNDRSEVMAAIQTPTRLVVLTPAGADHIRVIGTTAKVRSRLAVISVPSRTDLTVEALHGSEVIDEFSNARRSDP